MKPVAGIAICVLAGAVWAQETGEFKAREAFWIKAAPPANSAPAKTSKKTMATKRPGPAPASGGATVTAEANKAQPVTPSAAPVHETGGANIVKAGYAPLALRYSILQNKNGRFVEVDPDTEFHTGDTIRVRVQANDTAYLYIVMGGSSGQWKILFPDKEINHGNNRVENGSPCTIPPETDPAFRFDETAGVEKVSLILSRTPEADLEKLIYAADDHTRNAAQPKMIMASNTVVDGAFMGQVRNQMLSRDLVFEKYDGTTPDGQQDKAVYAATKDSSPNARLFVDLQLIHK